ncbi:uracil-DNA glycosylase [Fusibacter paucivorans]|uniref:Type-4 uracil-DNA glycosylase n=1 Tax=Fusibacter paucivorans TaxID=76009 RepID=A0ABS5PVV2_9FIRM|nr:uracil-DNA glycosylase [Fusibacter paucivorans]MBS7528332.1 uracil-DNA glycosylase [Fusibacter paucivorans]
MEASSEALTALGNQVLSCEKCALCKGRQNVVFGEGNPNAAIMFIGEGPGEMEDETGRPFVGKSGMLLDKIFEAADIRREDVYIANIVKCRPPGNRNPLPEEREACLPYLRQQTRLIKPKIIVLLGSVAAKALIDPQFKITKQHGQWIERKGFFMIATYHPSALLRNPALKKEAWSDFQIIRDKRNELETQ